jgi:hypothetical protein
MKIPLRNAACRDILLGILIFKGSLRYIFMSRSALKG